MDDMTEPVITLTNRSLRGQIRKAGERLHELDIISKFGSRELTDEERDEVRFLLERGRELRLEQEKRQAEDEIM